MSEPRMPYLSGDGMPVWDYKPDPDEPLRVILARIERKLDKALNPKPDRAKWTSMWWEPGRGIITAVDGVEQPPHFDVPIKPADDGWQYSNIGDYEVRHGRPVITPEMSAHLPCPFPKSEPDL